MIDNLDVVKILLKYLAGEIALPELREQTVELRLDHKCSSDARNLLNAIEGRYAEFSDGLVSENFLKDRFREMIQSLQPTSASNVNRPLVYVASNQQEQAVGILGQSSGSASSLVQPRLELTR